MRRTSACRLSERLTRSTKGRGRSAQPLASACAEASGWSDLPLPFVDLVNRSLSLQGLVRRMDDEIYGKNTVVPLPGTRSPNPVSDQITLLNTAFARG